MESPHAPPTLGVPALVLALVLAGFTFAHVDDGDALLYQVLGRNIRHTGSWFVVGWTPTFHPRFTEHLPLVAWPSAVLGPAVRLFSAACTFATWLILSRWLVQLGRPVAGAALLVLVAVTESYVGTQTTARIEPPFLLALVGAVVATAHRRAVLAGALLGVAVLLRGPLALLGVPMMALALWTEHRRPALRELILVPALAAAVVIGFHLADVAWGQGDSIERYLAGQVLPSILGGRSDGDPRRLATLFTLLERFWPGLLLVPLAFLRPPHRVRVLASAWVVLAVAGLSLGQRHVPHHALVVYPGLFLLAALGAEAVWLRTLGPPASVEGTSARAHRSFLHPRRWAAPLLLAAALGFAVVFPFVRSAARCDIARFTALRTAGHCEVVEVVTPRGEPDWQAATRIVEHRLGADFRFSSPGEVPTSPTCVPLAVSASTVPGWTLLAAGTRWSLYTRAPSP